MTLEAIVPFVAYRVVGKLSSTITLIYLKSMWDKNLLSHTIIEPILHIKTVSDLTLGAIQEKYIS